MTTEAVRPFQAIRAATRMTIGAASTTATDNHHTKTEARTTIEEVHSNSTLETSMITGVISGLLSLRVLLATNGEQAREAIGRTNKIESSGTRSSNRRMEALHAGMILATFRPTKTIEEAILEVIHSAIHAVTRGAIREDSLKAIRRVTETTRPNVNLRKPSLLTNSSPLDRKRSNPKQKKMLLSA